MAASIAHSAIPPSATSASSCARWTGGTRAPFRPGDSEDPLHCRVDILLMRIDLQRRGVARLRLRLLSLFFVNATEPIVGARDGGLVFFRAVREVLLQRHLAARHAVPRERRPLA